MIGYDKDISSQSVHFAASDRYKSVIDCYFELRQADLTERLRDNFRNWDIFLFFWLIFRLFYRHLAIWWWIEGFTCLRQVIINKCWIDLLWYLAKGCIVEYLISYLWVILHVVHVHVFQVFLKSEIVQPSIIRINILIGIPLLCWLCCLCRYLSITLVIVCCIAVIIVCLWLLLLLVSILMIISSGFIVIVSLVIVISIFFVISLAVPSCVLSPIIPLVVIFLIRSGIVSAGIFSKPFVAAIGAWVVAIPMIEAGICLFVSLFVKRPIWSSSFKYLQGFLILALLVWLRLFVFTRKRTFIGLDVDVEDMSSVIQVYLAD